VNLAVRAR